MKAALGVRFFAGAAVAAVAFFAVAIFAFLVGMNWCQSRVGRGPSNWLWQMLMGKKRLSKRAGQFFHAFCCVAARHCPKLYPIFSIGYMAATMAAVLQWVAAETY